MAVPDTGTVNVRALVGMVSTPLTGPTLVGANRTATRHRPATTTGAEHGDVLATIVNTASPLSVGPFTVNNLLGAALITILAFELYRTHDFWFLREMASAGHRPEGAQINCDISVPVSKVPDFIDKAGGEIEALCPGVRIVAFGHIGDGNIHYTIVQPVGLEPSRFPGEKISRAAHDCAHALNGSISAEHGIGVSRRAELPRYKSETQLTLMRTLKQALDPKRILNPRALI